MLFGPLVQIGKGGLTVFCLPLSALSARIRNTDAEWCGGQQYSTNMGKRSRTVAWWAFTTHLGRNTGFHFYKSALYDVAFLKGW